MSFIYIGEQIFSGKKRHSKLHYSSIAGNYSTQIRDYRQSDPENKLLKSSADEN